MIIKCIRSDTIIRTQWKLKWKRNIDDIEWDIFNTNGDTAHRCELCK